MSFGFLTPMFFAGLALLAAPVLIHLVARREIRGRLFPSLMFLRNLPIKRARHRELRDPWLLLLRLVALLLLVLAFAGPYVLNDAQSPMATQAVNQTIIAVDRSYSMRFEQRWSRALEQARSAIDALSATDRAALVFFDDSAHTSVPMTADTTELQQALAAARPGDANTDYARVLAHAPQLFLDDLPGARKLLVISDMQRSGLHNNRSARLPQSIELELTDVARANPVEMLLTGVQVLGSDLDSARVNLSVKINAGGVSPGRRLDVRVDGHLAESRELTDAEIADGSAAVGVVPARDHLSRVQLSIGDADNDHSVGLILARVEPVTVTLLSADADAHSATYLQQSLSLAARPAVVVQRAAAAALNSGALASTDVVILDDAPLRDGAAVARLEQFVAAGGGLFVIAGTHPAPGAPILATALLPGRLGGDLPAGSRLTELLAHPALTGLRIDQLRNAPVWRRRALTVEDGDIALANYGDGTAALVERRVGSGSTVLLSTGIGNQWSALALEPGFAPLAIALIRHLAKRQVGAGASAVSVGETVDIARQAALLGAQELLNQLARDGGIVIESPAGVINKVAGPRPAFVPREAGVYKLHVPGGTAAPMPLAANVDARELQFDVMSAAELDAQVVREAPDTPAADARLAADGNLPPTSWWYILSTVVILLLIEGLYAARLTRSGGSRHGHRPRAV